jgi:hypothetical protein
VFVLFDHREQLLGLVSRNFAASILEVEADRFAWSLVGTVAALAAFVDEAQPLRDTAGVREPDVARVIATASSSLARRLKTQVDLFLFCSYNPTAS